jgi:hypothetical protein
MKRTILEDPTLDAFARDVLHKLDPEVFTSLSPRQYAAVRDTLVRASPIRRHPVDLRGVIRLGVVRYYFVFLAGRDRRHDTRQEERKVRRRVSSVLGAVVLGSILLVPTLSAILLVTYAVKSFLGIDLDPNHHLIDFLR